MALSIVCALRLEFAVEAVQINIRPEHFQTIARRLFALVVFLLGGMCGTVLLLFK